MRDVNSLTARKSKASEYSLRPNKTSDYRDYLTN
jgi:hypothetical protein